MSSEAIRPYLPRLTVDWAREHPDLRWMAVDGSLAFVDISGFTKMSERLARHGKVGAEEVDRRDRHLLRGAPRRRVPARAAAS